MTVFRCSFCFSFQFSFLLIMGNSESSEQGQKQKDTGTSPIIEAKSLLSKGDVAGAFSVLKEGAENGNVMACFDCGFMMIQGIGCKKDLKEGLELMEKGRKLEKQSRSMNWKSDGSVTELFEPQTMELSGLLF